MSDALESEALDIAVRRIAKKRMAANANPASSFGTGVNKALIDIVGFPVDAANAGLNLIGMGSETPIGGSKQLTGLAEKAGLVNEAGRPVTGFERAGRVVGASLPGFGVVGAAARARKGAGLAIETVKGARSATKPGGIFSPMVESFAAAPRTTAAIEAVSAGGAAVGGEIGRAVGDDSEVGQIIGEIVGGIAAPTTALVATKLPMVKLIGQATRPLRPKAQKKLAAGVLEDATGDRALTLAKDPGFEPLEGTKFTLGEKLNDQNLITLEQSVAKKIPGLADDMIKNRAQTNKAISDSLNNFSGSVAGVDTKDRTVQLFQATKSRLKNAMNARMAGAVKLAQDKVATLKAQNTRADISKIMNDELEDALKDARGQEKFIWNALDEKEAITLRHSKEAMDQFIGEQTPVPQFVRNFLDFEDMKTLDFKEVKEFRTNLINVQKEARAAGRSDISFFLQKVNDGILKDISNSSLSDDFGIAVDFSRELNSRFTRGRIGKAMRFAPRGGRAVQDTSISEELFPSSPIKASEGFEAAMKATGPMPGVEGTNQQRNMIAATEDLLKTRLFDTTGEFNETAARSMLTKKGEFLRQFPELTQQIHEAIGSVSARDVLAKRLKGARGNLKDKGKSALALITNSRSDQVMPKIMSSPNRKRLLSQAVRKAKKEDLMAYQGLQDGYTDELFKHGLTGATNMDGQRIISGMKMEEYFNATIKDAVDSGLWDEGQASRLKNIIANAKRAEAVGTNEQQINKLLEDKTSFLNDFIIRVIGAGAGGRVSKKMLGTGTLVSQTAGSKVARKIAESLPQESIIQILGNAVRDEKVYKELLELDTSEAFDTRQAQRIHSWLMGMGIEMVTNEEQ
jgi:hypothetical protein